MYFRRIQTNEITRQRLADKTSALVLVMLIALVWVAHFLYFKSLGLYEDDYAYVGSQMTWKITDLYQAIMGYLTTWPQGHPLGFSIPEIIIFFGYRLGGLPALYIAGASILTVNAFVFYLILKSIGSETIAVLGALVFCLFPADTSRSFIVNLIQTQLSMTFFVAATLLYISGRTKLSYLVILGALLTYETGYIVFLGVPLLERPWDREWVKRFLKHVAVLGVIMLADYVVRRLLGESRVVEMGNDAISLPPKIIVGMIIGPLASLAQFLLAPIRTLLSLDPAIIAAALFCSVAFALVLANLKPAIQGEPLASSAPVGSANQPAGNDPQRSRSLAAMAATWRKFDQVENWFATLPPRLAAKGLNQDVAEYCANTAGYPLFGSFWLIISYALTFTHFPPIAQHGRGTSVHLAGAFGASVLAAWIFSVILFAARDSGLRRIAIAGLALYLGVLVGYGIVIQKDLQLSWQYQRAFWTSVVEVAPDLNDGTVIFVTRAGLPETYYIFTHAWSDPIILNLLFRFPETWQQVPRLFVINEDLSKTVKVNGDKLEWMVPGALWEEHKEDLPDGNVILLKPTAGGLARQYGSLNIQGKSLNLKGPGPGENPQFEKKPLYGLLIDEPQLDPR